MFETILTLDFRKWNSPNLLKIDPGLEIWWGTDFISSFSPQRLESWGGSDKEFLWSLLVKKSSLDIFRQIRFEQMSSDSFGFSPGVGIAKR